MPLLDTYQYIVTDLADPRTNDWTLISSPIPLTLISIWYLYFIIQWGPNYMKNKQPYSFQTFIRFYNVFQIVANGLLIYHTLEVGWYNDYFVYCAKVEFDTNPKSMKIAAILWYTFILKLIDYIETVLFVLRKKNRQISFLHVYHHVGTAYVSWIAAKYYPNGVTLTILLTNCVVHVIMYTYYLFASFGPGIQPYIQRVKPMITMVQLVQFFVLILYSLQAFSEKCNVTKGLTTMLIVHLIVNIVLFTNFYKKNYNSKKIKAK